MSEKPSRIRLLIVEDDAVVRIPLRSVLERYVDLEIIGDTEFGEDAVQVVQDQAPDVVLLDMLLKTSEITGQETLEKIVASSPSTHVVILSAHPEDEFVFPALSAGAMGYLLKTSLPDEVVEAIRDAAQGKHHLSPEITKKLIQRLIGDGANMRTDLFASFTRREKELLPLLVKGLTNKQIAQQLSVTPATVKTHVSNILKKSGLSSRAKLPLLWVQHNGSPRQ